MNTVHYDIRDFLWVKDSNTFYGDGWDLYPSEEPYYLGEFPNECSTFPNGRKRFIIKNYKTENFRRFTFQKEETDPFGTYRVFESEDGIRCIINFD